MSDGAITAQLAQIAVALADACGIEEVCGALEAGFLRPDSTAAVRAAITRGNATLEGCVRTLQEVWRAYAPTLAAEAMALVLRASAHAAVRRVSPQVVWTGPNVEGSFLRATREVVRELLRDVRRELLVVGYWIAAYANDQGIIAEVITSIAEAVARHVAVTVIVDERTRPDGRDNRQVLISIWPQQVLLPTILTWRLPLEDQHLKLHAKVLVADRCDALVTSANLTSHAMDRNMEMGARLVGRPAEEIARHFELLALRGVLEPYHGPAVGR